MPLMQPLGPQTSIGVPQGKSVYMLGPTAMMLGSPGVYAPAPVQPMLRPVKPLP
jgi:hypothetical protein